MLDMNILVLVVLLLCTGICAYGLATFWQHGDWRWAALTVVVMQFLIVLFVQVMLE